MVARHWRRTTVATVALLAVGLLAPPTTAPAQDKVEPDMIPKAVMDALKARFPKAEIDVCTRETEKDAVLYDIEFTQEGRRFEADFLENGAIQNWEREIAAGGLPAAVVHAVEKRYPKSRLGVVMAITAVSGGKEALEGYEITLETADKREVEVTVAPDGTILEDAGEIRT